MGLFDFFNKATPPAPAPGPAPKPKITAFASSNDIVPNRGGSYQVAPQYDNRRQESKVYLDGYLHCPWVRPCVDMIARSGSKQWKLVPKNPQSTTMPTSAYLQEVEPILNFMNAPNDIDTWSSLTAKIIRDMVIQGSCILYLGRSSVDVDAVRATVTKAFNPFAAGISNLDQEIEDVVGEVAINGIPTWLKVLPFDQMEVVTDNNGYIIGYVQWTIDGRRINFSPSEIMQIFHPMSSSSTYGDSLLQPIVTIMTTDALIDRRQKKILQGDIAIDSLFTLPDTANEEETKRIYEQLNTMYRKNGNDATFFVSNGDLKYQNVSKAKDGDFLQQGLDNRNSIAMHLGVPISVLGDTTGTASTYNAGSDNALRSFLENTVRPLTNHIEHHMNREIMAAFGNIGLDYVIEYVLEDADDMSDVEAMYNVAINNGTMTRNEKRMKMGFDPIPDGDIITVTAGNQCVTLDAIINPPAVVPPNNNPDVEKALVVQEAREALRALRKSM